MFEENLTYKKSPNPVLCWVFCHHHDGLSHSKKFLVLSIHNYGLQHFLQEISLWYLFSVWSIQWWCMTYSRRNYKSIYHLQQKRNTNKQNAKNTKKKKTTKGIAYAFRLKKLSYRNLEKKNNIRWTYW